MTITTWYSNRIDNLHGLRVGILFAADAAIDISQVIQSDNRNFLYMIVDRNQFGVNETVAYSFDSRSVCSEY
jgi:hypothetical protein